MKARRRARSSSDMPYEEPYAAAGCRARRGDRDADAERRDGFALRASLLRFSPLIPGVNYPMTYVGARNTFFCWHVEDNHLYATNYVVAGAPKVWYGVPPSAMARMEEVWRAVFPALVSRHPDLYYWKTCIFSPAVLRAFGIPVYRATHEAGAFMPRPPRITPDSTRDSTLQSRPTLHSRIGCRMAAAAYAATDRPTRDTTLLHEALLCTRRTYAQLNELPALLTELRQMRQDEQEGREKLKKAGVIVPNEPQEADLGGGVRQKFEHPWADGSDDKSHFFDGAASLPAPVLASRSSSADAR